MSSGAHPIAATFRRRGFLPAEDPQTAFPDGSEFAILETIGRDLPSWLHDPGFRRHARALSIPLWPEHRTGPAELPALRLYYLRLGFLASGYINQVGEEPAHVLPHNIAAPLCQVGRILGRPPILSYDGYALYNWKRFRRAEPIALGNIDTIQNFVHLYDEHWFILVHVEIEAIAARILDAMARVQATAPALDAGVLDEALRDIEAALRAQIGVLGRISEKMDPALYYRTFRPYIRMFDNVVYEGMDQAPIDFRGETGAQSSILPTLIAFLKIPHQATLLTEHLADLRNYMPPEHRAIIELAEAMPPIRAVAGKGAYNAVLDALAEFRELHFRWAQEYINRWTDDPRGTGGTPYMRWLKQLIDETRAFKLS